MKRSFDEFRNALPEEHRSNAAWGFGFDRVRFVDKIEEQIQAAVALSAPVVTITDTFREAIDILWSACIDAVGWLADANDQMNLLNKGRCICLWLCAVMQAI